jgi:hypothetical protein
MFLQDMSRSERESFEEIFNACETFINLADELVAEEENADFSPWTDE